MTNLGYWSAPRKALRSMAMSKVASDRSSRLPSAHVGGARTGRDSISEKTSPPTDRGGILPIVGMIICLTGLGFASVASTAAGSIAVMRAIIAAESTAMAAALGMESRETAAANGATVLSQSELVAEGWTGTPSGWRVVVEVERRGVRARAAATPPHFHLTSGSRALAHGGTAANGGKRAGLAPPMLEALIRADRLLAERGLPAPIPVVSGYRSIEEQMYLWARRATNPYPVAPPGRSAHNRGMAVDIPRSWIGPTLSVAREAGLCQPFPTKDPIHFVPVDSAECGGNGALGGKSDSGDFGPDLVRLADNVD